MKKIEYFETYTNLAYNVAGFISFFLYHDVLICIAFQALGISSFTYHHDKSPDRAGDTIWKFDWWAMALMNTVVAGYYFNSIEIWGYLLLFHVFYGYVIMGKFHVFLEVAISSVIAFTAIFMNRSLATSSIILAVFIIGLVVRAQDKDSEQLTYHDSIYHGIWHFITAFGYYLVFHLNI